MDYWSVAMMVATMVVMSVEKWVVQLAKTRVQKWEA